MTPPQVTRDVRIGGYRVCLDLSGQVLRLSVPDEYGPNVGHTENVPSPTLSDALHGAFVSAAILVQKAKQFDDGLYAAIERAAQDGLGHFPGKASLLLGLTRVLARGAGSEEPLALLLSASLLGGLTPIVSSSLRPRVDEVTREFLQNELRSKPLGFYTWTEDLRAVFRQDRLLQSELTEAGTGSLTEALLAEPGLCRIYEGYLELVSKLTNPAAKPDLRPLLAARGRCDFDITRAPSLFPPSVSHEGEWIKKVYGEGPVPEGVSIIDELTQQIRAGAIRLAPTSNSGWYDYQTWAHEPFVIPEKMPEAARLKLEAGYRKSLLDLFKGTQALARETHVKQLESPDASAAMPTEPRRGPTMLAISPGLSAEPLATHYLRRAQGYRFVRSVLKSTFGAAALGLTHRLTPDGPAALDLDTELWEIEFLFWGAYLTVCRQIGLVPDPTLPVEALSEAHAERFASWAKKLSADQDLRRDARMMVPVFYDLARQKTKVWLFLGWAVRSCCVGYEIEPAAAVFDSKGRKLTLGGDVQVVFHEEGHSLVFPITTEVYVTRLLDREEFRRHCDQHRTREAILANLR